MVSRVTSIVLKAVEKNLEFSALSQGAPVTGSTVVFGPGGLDSIGLVNLIVDLESDLAAPIAKGGAGIAVTLADERAMSRSSSPFRTVDSLVDFILDLAARP